MSADMIYGWVGIIALLLVHYLHQGVISQSTDITCLEQIKSTLVDPNNALQSWTFTDLSGIAICGYFGVQCIHPSEVSVYSLSLPGMGLEGSFPQGWSYCTSLTSLDLSSNAFTGPIPDNLGNLLPYLVKLDLSSNLIKGSIPSSLSNCTYLNSLRLQNNDLTGPIPGQIGLLARMKDIDLSNNQLSGQIPYTFANFTPQDFQGNPGLCGSPLSKKCNSSGSGVSAGVVAGVVVAVVLAIGLIACLTIWFIVFRRRQGRSLIMSDENTWVLKIKAPRMIQVSMFEQPLVKIKLSDLLAATNNFSKDNVIGIGRTGIFYKATLRDGSTLAIKRLRPSPHNDRQFRAEMDMLGKLRHRNLVPLLGFCIAGSERLLVYKHMINGTVQTRLHECDESERLDWPTRLRIGIGAARGLAWLHHSCNPRIIHRNISSTSILLDEDFDARITDFGLARLMNPLDTHVSTYVNGDFGDVGYVAPEYTRTLVATIKGDVYGFGVVLLELVTGQKPVDLNVDGDFKGTLAEWVGILSNSGRITEAIDKSLINRGTDNELLQFLRVGCACVLTTPRDRPSMYEVLQLLRAIGEKYHFTDQDEEIPILSQTVDIE